MEDASPIELRHAYDCENDPPYFHNFSIPCLCIAGSFHDLWRAPFWWDPANISFSRRSAFFFHLICLHTSVSYVHYENFAGDCRVNLPTKWSTGVSQNAGEKVVASSDHDLDCPFSTPVSNPTEFSSHNKENYKSNSEGYLWLGSRGSKGTFTISIYLQKCMLKYFFFL